MVKMGAQVRSEGKGGRSWSEERTGMLAVVPWAIDDADEGKDRSVVDVVRGRVNEGCSIRILLYAGSPPDGPAADGRKFWRDTQIAERSKRWVGVNLLDMLVREYITS